MKTSKPLEERQREGENSKEKKNIRRNTFIIFLRILTVSGNEFEFKCINF